VPPHFLNVAASTGYALGVAALGLGRAGEALGNLEAVDAILSRGGVREPAVIPVGADLVETYLKLSRREDARSTASRLTADAERTGRPGAAAGAARCRGMLADDAAFEAHFDRALALHDAVGAPLERARTLLCFGQRLRRHRRRRDAARRLHQALTLFEEAGAEGWAQQCRAELTALGQHPAPSAERPADLLTPQERQVGAAAADGLTNQEIAVRLFLSPKTVDYHLGKVYRKLGIRSRTELARALSPRVGRAAAPVVD
jgi:DNA-binding CsgD family transcriptional regulator